MNIRVRFHSMRLQVRSITSKSWMKRHVNDVYVKEAKVQDLRSRSAFKLLEIHEKHKIFRKNDVIVDLGCSPGGWCLIAKRFVSFTNSLGGKIIGVDLLPMESIEHVEFIQGDFLRIDTQRSIIRSVCGSNHTHVNDMLSNPISSSTTAIITPFIPCINVIMSDMLHNSTGMITHRA